MRAIDRAIAVLECFTVERPSVSLSEIGRLAGLPKATAFRMVGALRRLGYLERDADDRLILSSKVGRLADVFLSTYDVRRVAQPVMEQLARESGETVTLNALVGNERVCIHVSGKPSMPTAATVAGEHAPLGLGGASMVLMAYRSVEELQRLLPLAARTARCTRKELRSILETVRRQGYAVSHGGGVAGFSGLSAPIFDRDGVVRHCLTILPPTTTVRDRVGPLVQLARQAAADISIRLASPQVAPARRSPRSSARRRGQPN